MKILFTKKWCWSWGSCPVLGNWVASSWPYSYYKHEQTIYYLGFIRIVITHEDKFIKKRIK